MLFKPDVPDVQPAYHGDHEERCGIRKKYALPVSDDGDTKCRNRELEESDLPPRKRRIL